MITLRKNLCYAILILEGFVHFIWNLLGVLFLPDRPYQLGRLIIMRYGNYLLHLVTLIPTKATDTILNRLRLGALAILWAQMLTVLAWAILNSETLLRLYHRN